MSYCVGKKSAKYTFHEAILMLELLGIQVIIGKVADPKFKGSKGLTTGQVVQASYPYFLNYRSDYRITIDKDLPLEDQKLTLSHEMAHIILGHLVGKRISKDYNISHEQMEFEAESLGLLLCNFLFGFGESKEQGVTRCTNITLQTQK